MTHPSKAKGNAYERELVKDAQAVGLAAERAWGSNGRALGESEGVDVVIAGQRVQAKRRKAIPGWLTIPEGADVVAFRSDRGETLVLVRMEDWLNDLCTLADCNRPDCPQRQTACGASSEDKGR